MNSEPKLVKKAKPIIKILTKIMIGINDVESQHIRIFLIDNLKNKMIR